MRQAPRNRNETDVTEELGKAQREKARNDLLQNDRVWLRLSADVGAVHLPAVDAERHLVAVLVLIPEADSAQLLRCCRRRHGHVMRLLQRRLARVCLRVCLLVVLLPNAHVAAVGEQEHV